jgi:HSP20 family protein
MTTEIAKSDNRDLASAERTRGGTTYSPRIDIRETDDELLLLADLPGVPPEDLEIQFENNELTIHGRVPKRHETRRFVGGEYGIGDFFRTFRVGETIDAANISAELNHGVLTLHLPKSEAVKPRRIDINSG